jgi:hypothetical protein
VSDAPIRFLTNHGLCVLLIADDPLLRVRDLATAIGVTERRCHKIVTDLAEAGYLTRTHVGRRTVYEVDKSASLMFVGGEGVILDSLLAALRQ